MYLNSKNPFERNSPSAIHPIQYFDFHASDIMSEVWSNENDGIIIKGTGDYMGQDLYLVFEPEQIKIINKRS